VTGYIAVLITSTLLNAYTEQRPMYRTLARCEAAVLAFTNSSFFHRGFCTVRRNLTEDDIQTYGGFKD